MTCPAAPDPYAGFQPGFFARADDRDDAVFYTSPRLVTHIDDAAIAAVGELYAELGIDGSAPAPSGCWTSCPRGCRTSAPRRRSCWCSA